MSTGRVNESSLPIVVRVVERPAARRPALASAPTRDDLGALLREGRAHATLADFVDAWCWQLVAAGIPLARVMVSVGTLHPQQIGFGATWTREDGVVRESVLPHAVRTADIYLNSPMYRVFEHGETVRRRLDGANGEDDFPILAELRAAGMTDYLAVPLLMGKVNRNAATFATDAAGGFTQSDVARLERLGPGLSTILERIAWQRIAATLLEVYLGRQAGARVLAGEVTRGSGEARRAVIWVSDLRGFTRLSDRLPGARVIEILNRALEGQVAAIHAHGGEVLKFVGDGVVAIFPIDDIEFAPAACASALAAARAALADNAAFNRVQAASPDAGALAMVAVLHVGEVFYGNIGGRDRLDFTVIGPAVNVASRLERLAKSLDRPLLVTADFVAAARIAGLPSLGAHPLRGLAEPVEVFALPHPPRDAPSD